MVTKRKYVQVKTPQTQEDSDDDGSICPVVVDDDLLAEDEDDTLDFPTWTDEKSDEDSCSAHSIVDSVGTDKSTDDEEQETELLDSANGVSETEQSDTVPAPVPTVVVSPNVEQDTMNLEDIDCTQQKTLDELRQSQEIKFGISLMMLGKKSNAPLKYYDEHVRLFKKFYPNCPRVPSRARLLRILKAKLGCVTPTMNRLRPDSPDVVPTFSLLAQLKDLLCSEYFQSLDKCCVNSEPTKRFEQYSVPAAEGRSEIPSGQWYTDTYSEFIGEQTVFFNQSDNQFYHNWLLPVIFYNDKTGASAMEGSYTLEPLMFSLGLIRRTYREKSNAWRHLGFIPSCSNKKETNVTVNPEEMGEEQGNTTQPKKKSLNDGEKSLTFTHECLSLLLQELVTLQANPPCFEVKLFGEEKPFRIRAILQVAFVMGDQLSQDTHCCRKKINTGGAGRVHRSCFTSYMNADIPPKVGRHCCYMNRSVLEDLCNNVWLWENEKRRAQYISETMPTVESHLSKTLRGLARKDAVETLQGKVETCTEVRAQTSREILEKVFSLYPVHNAWSSVSFGSNKDGIHRATLDDPMHYSSLGLFMYLLETVFGILHPAEARLVEKYMREDASGRCSIRYDLPRGKFIDGFTNCTLQTASEKIGIIYQLFFSLGTERVAVIFERAILRQQQKYLCAPCAPDNPKRKQEETPSWRESRVPKKQKRSKNTAPPQAQVPWYDHIRLVSDQYFFKKPPPPTKTDPHPPAFGRSIDNVHTLLEQLESFGVLSSLQSLLPHFDSLQAEYLLQATFDSISTPLRRKQIESPPKGWKSHKLPHKKVHSLSQKIHSQLRQKNTSKEEIVNYIELEGDESTEGLTKPSEVRQEIPKHWFSKPKQKGIGNTCAVLTDVNGLRSVLLNCLLFHAGIHEFHNLNTDLQENLDGFSKFMNEKIDNVLCRMYRGDNSVDVRTCKCHAHYHLARDIIDFGAPMGFEASKGERNLKPWAKFLGNLAQKCGEEIFLSQTAARASEDMLIETAHFLIVAYVPKQSLGASIRAPPRKEANGIIFTRKKPHLVYDLATQTAKKYTNKKVTEDEAQQCEHSNLLTPQVKEVLAEKHGAVGEIRIWKEAKIALDETGIACHFVRAYHQYDRFGSYFDWVDLTNEKPVTGDSLYVPALVLLMYCTTDGKRYAIVWTANKRPTVDLRQWESDISARWRMQLQENGVPYLEVVPLENFNRCMKVYKHWTNSKGCHLPANVGDQNQSNQEYVLDEAYERENWLLNALDKGRWKKVRKGRR